MPTLNPPPQTIPPQYTEEQQSRDFFTKLKDSLYTLWFACGGNNGLPTLNIMSNHDSGGSEGYNEFTGSTGAPTVDPGWADSDTVGMTPPDGYIRVRVGTRLACVPYWFVAEEDGFLLLEDDGKIELEDGSGFIIGEDS